MNDASEHTFIHIPSFSLDDCWMCAFICLFISSLPNAKQFNIFQFFLSLSFQCSSPRWEPQISVLCEAGQQYLPQYLSEDGRWTSELTVKVPGVSCLRDKMDLLDYCKKVSCFLLCHKKNMCNYIIVRETAVTSAQVFLRFFYTIYVVVIDHKNFKVLCNKKIAVFR